MCFKIELFRKFGKGIKCNNVEVQLEMLDICEKTYSIKADSFELKKAALLENAVDGIIVMLVAGWQGCGSVLRPWQY